MRRRELGFGSVTMIFQKLNRFTMLRCVRWSIIALIPSLAAFLPAQDPPKQVSPKQDPPKSDVTQKLWSEIGYSSLAARLGDAVPKGENVWMAQVEASESGKGKPPQFRPDLKEVFDGDRPGFVMNVSGGNTSPVSGHATGTAQYLFGKYSMAKGVLRVDAIHAETEFVQNWLGFPSRKPRTDSELPKISSHSYVDSTPMPMMVRRLDHLIAETGHIAVVAVGKNEQGGPVEPIFGSNYNAITVGLTSTKCGSGLTRDGDDVPQRTKPDIVVPADTTSMATPIVASAAALLVQTAGEDKVASKPITIKAALMAGANKTFPSLDLVAGWKTDRKQDNPLHPKFGAGQLDINTSHRILTGGRKKPGTAIESKTLDGWGVESIEANGAPHTFIIDVPDEQSAATVSVALTWNRRFVDPDFTPVVPQFDLTFGPVDASGEFDKVLDRSRSRQDNVELIWYVGNLPPGKYGLRVTNNGEHNSDYAIAWHVATKAAPGAVRDKPRTRQSVSSWVYYTIAGGIMLGSIILWRLRPYFSYMAVQDVKKRRK